MSTPIGMNFGSNCLISDMAGTSFSCLDVGDRDAAPDCRADSIAAWRTHWVASASVKSTSGTTGAPPPMTVRMSLA